MTNSVASVQKAFKHKIEHILQCNSCQTNLFHLVKVGSKQVIECSGCGHKRELK